ncbi:MAG TPA: hypothetical protein VHN19_15740 [Burkholderiales bacterium]|jgi:hypothetical protein|nr:hypothetical protein [Burkholderiales bacterium]
MAKRKKASGTIEVPFDEELEHPGGVTGEEIAKVLADVEECFRRQSEFFSRMARRSRTRIHTFKPTRHSR